MSPEEFDVQFDVLYNNITSNQAPGLNEYEKSVFLTKAQDEILKNHFISEANILNKGIDANTKRQIDFSNLIKVSEINTLSVDSGFDERSVTVILPDDIMFILNESVSVVNNTTRKNKQIRYLDYANYSTLMSKPYKRPLKNQVWRLLFNGASNNNVAELILGYKDVFEKYVIKYIKKPNPIIVGDISQYGVTIEGFGDVTECEVNPMLHDEILQRAVELAKAAYVVTQSNEIQLLTTLGQRSE